MILKKWINVLTRSLFCLLIAKNTLATSTQNPFEGKWENDLGVVEIDQCNGMSCNIKISTANGTHMCDLKEKLTVLSNENAVLEVQLASSNSKKRAPINISLFKQRITIKIPKQSWEQASSYCGIRGYFEGVYTNTNAPRTYSTSYNCDKAATKIENTICQSRDLATADLNLSKVYLQLKARGLHNIEIQQKAWINDRNNCINSIEFDQCLLDKYRDRILLLQQNIIGKNSLEEFKDTFFNFEYLQYLSKLSEKEDPHAIFNDTPLQSYLKKSLLPQTYEKIKSAIFIGLHLENNDNSLIMIHGEAPGLHQIYEGALALTSDHKTWLAYIDFDGSKKQLIILSNKNTDLRSMPNQLAQWVLNVLPEMDAKDAVHKKILL